MRNFAFTCLVTLFTTSPALAAGVAPWRTERPKVPAAKAPTLPSFQKVVLKNGLTILVTEVDALPVVSFNLVTKGGATFESTDKAGLTSLTYDMLEEGAGSLGALEFSDAIADLGASFGAGSSRDSGSISASGLAVHADAMLGLVADAALRPKLDAQSFERRKAQTIATLVRRRGSPQGIAFEKVPAMIYGSKHPFGHPPTGTPESLAALTHEDVKKHYASIMGPKHSALIVAGSLSLDAAKALAEKHFGAWTSTAKAPPAVPGVQASARTEVHLIDKPGAPQTMMIVGRPMFAKGHADEDAMVLANLVFGGNFGARLNMNLREDKGYTYGASSQAAFRAGVGVFLVYTALRADVTGAGLKETIDELKRLQSKPPTDVELQAARSGLIRSLPGKFEVTSAIAGAAAGLFIHGLPLDHFAGVATRYQAVSLSDVQAMATKYLSPEPMQILLVGDASVIEPQIESLKLGTLVKK